MQSIAQATQEGAWTDPDSKTSLARQGDEWVVTKPPVAITNFIASGAGAKGLAYPGAYRAMVETGYMAGVENVVGASSGAMMGALMACGIRPDVLDHITNRADFITLMKRQESKPGSATNPSKSGLCRLGVSLALNLGTTAPGLHRYIADATRNAVQDVLSKHGIASPGVALIADRLHAGEELRFGDMRTLHAAYPQHIKAFHCVATTYIDGMPQLASYNADTTPNLSIAQAATSSGLLPFIFKRADAALPDFMMRGQSARANDGGMMLNYPIPELLDSSIENHDPAQNLVLMAASPQIRSGIDAGSSSGRSLGGQIVSKVAQKTLGFNYMSRDTSMYRAATEGFGGQLVMSPTRANGHDYGDNLGLLRVDMPQADRVSMQQQSFAATKQHLDGRQSTETRFTSMHEALLTFDDARFAAFATSAAAKQSPEAVRATRQAGAIRSASRTALESLATRAAGWNADTSAAQISGDLHRWAATLPADVTHAGIARTFLQQRLTGSVADRPIVPRAALERAGAVLQSSRPQSPTLAAWSNALEARDVARIGKTLARDLIDPAKTRIGQSAANRRLLEAAGQQLKLATRRDDVNDVLDRLSSDYRSRLPDKLTALRQRAGAIDSSSFAEQVQAHRLTPSKS